MDVGWFGCVKVEHQNCRRNGENAIAERRDAANLFASQSVVMGRHGPTIAFELKRVNPARAVLPSPTGEGLGVRVRAGSARIVLRQGSLIRRAIARHLLPGGEGRGAARRLV